MRKKIHAPAFQFYPSDWLACSEISLLSLEEEGAYIRLLAHCWLHGSIPVDPVLAARLIGKGGCTLLASKVLPMFQPDPNDPSKLVHEQLEAERLKQEDWRMKSSKGGKKSAITRERLRESKGGSTTVPRVVQANVNRPLGECYEPNGNIPSSSSSSLTSVSSKEGSDASLGGTPDGTAEAAPSPEIVEPPKKLSETPDSVMATLVLPDCLKSQEGHAAFAKWVKHRMSITHKPLKWVSDFQDQLDRHLSLLESDTAIYTLEECTRLGYAGLFTKTPPARRAVTATRSNLIDLTRQLQATEDLIRIHPANPESASYQSPEKRPEFVELFERKRRLKEAISKGGE
jgi:uncharacterized protein YdaU (DUF1376 family)